MPQSLARVLVHIVFSTKSREPLIAPETEPELYPYLASVCRAHESPAPAVGRTADHVHILCSLSRSVSIAKLIEELKTESSKWMKRRGCAGFYWQAGYGAFSIGECSVAAARRYIAQQKQDHRESSFKE
jgi:REP element-mobilizing transposase RayT